MMRQPRIKERVRRAKPPRKLSVAQVARRLSVSESTVKRNIYSGDLAAVRVGRAAWRVSEADLDRFMAERSNRADEGIG